MCWVCGVYGILCLLCVCCVCTWCEGVFCVCGSLCWVCVIYMLCSVCVVCICMLCYVCKMYDILTDNSHANSCLLAWGQLASAAFTEPVSSHTSWPSLFCRLTTCTSTNPVRLFQSVPLLPSSAVLCSLWALSVGRRKYYLPRKIRHFQVKFKIPATSNVD